MCFFNGNCFDATFPRLQRGAPCMCSSWRPWGAVRVSGGRRSQGSDFCGKTQEIYGKTEHTVDGSEIPRPIHCFLGELQGAIVFFGRFTRSSPKREGTNTDEPGLPHGLFRLQLSKEFLVVMCGNRKLWLPLAGCYTLEYVEVMVQTCSNQQKRPVLHEFVWSKWIKMRKKGYLTVGVVALQWPFVP